MLTRILLQARSSGSLLARQARRNLGVSAVVSQKASDPIQQLFLDKVHDYAKKSKAAAGGLVDATAGVQKSLQDDLDKLSRAYGASGDMTQFPTFSFQDPVLEAVGVNVEAKAETDMGEIEASEEVQPEEKYYWEP